MNAFTKVSDKGQVVVPKAIRDRLGWDAGTDLEVIETADAIVLQRARRAKPLSVDDAVARFRQLYRHSGDPVGIDQMRRDAQDMASGGDRDR